MNLLQNYLGELELPIGLDYRFEMSIWVLTFSLMHSWRQLLFCSLLSRPKLEPKLSLGSLVLVLPRRDFVAGWIESQKHGFTATTVSDHRSGQISGTSQILVEFAAKKPSPTSFALSKVTLAGQNNTIITTGLLWTDYTDKLTERGSTLVPTFCHFVQANWEIILRLPFFLLCLKLREMEKVS